MTITSVKTLPDRGVVRERIPSRLASIDALRGMACLWVLLHHTFPSQVGQAAPRQWLYRTALTSAGIGWLGVHLFLVLSGFCLFYPLARKWPGGPVALDVSQFWKRRAQRILPPYYAALALSVCATALYQWRHHVPVTGSLSGVWAVPMHLLMLQNLHPDVVASVNAVFWSLALETQLYLIFPLLAYGAGRYGFRAVLFGCFLGSILWQTLVFSRLGFQWGYTPLYSVWYSALPGRAFEFAAGMAAAVCAVHSHPATLRRAAIAASLLLPLGLWYVLTIARWGPFCDQIWGAFFACLAILAAGTPARWFKAGALPDRLAGIGAFSYSIYLVHYPLLALVTARHLHIAILSETAVLCFGLFRVGAVLGLSALFYCLFERPWVRRIQRESHAATLSQTAYHGEAA